jgi:hypothetical protein
LVTDLMVARLLAAALLVVQVVVAVALALLVPTEAILLAISAWVEMVEPVLSRAHQQPMLVVAVVHRAIAAHEQTVELAAVDWVAQTPHGELLERPIRAAVVVLEMVIWRMPLVMRVVLALLLLAILAPHKELMAGL